MRDRAAIITPETNTFKYFSLLVNKKCRRHITLELFEKETENQLIPVSCFHDPFLIKKQPLAFKKHTVHLISFRDSKQKKTVVTFSKLYPEELVSINSCERSAGKNDRLNDKRLLKSICTKAYFCL